MQRCRIEGFTASVAFISQLLLGLFQDTVVDDPVQGKFLVEDAAAVSPFEHVRSFIKVVRLNVSLPILPLLRVSTAGLKLSPEGYLP